MSWIDRINSFSRESSSSSSSEEETPFSEIKLPSFSIHKINARFRNITPGDTRTFQEAVGSWIDDLVLKKKEEAIGLKFHRITFPNEDWWNPSENYNFFLRLFFCSAPGSLKVAKFLKKAGAKEDFGNISTNYMFFFYRQLEKTADVAQEIFEVFALTQGKAWQALSNRDFQFSDKVIRKIADPNLKKEALRDLVGHTLLETHIYREKHAATLSDHIYTLTQNFETSVKKEASLRSCRAFLTKKRKATQREITLKRGLGYVRFEASLSLSGYASILDHFSKISRNEPTFLNNDLQEEEIEDPEFDYLDYIQPVNRQKGKILWDEFKKLFHASFIKNDHLQIALCHRYTNDFFSSPITIEMHQEKIKKWERAPLFSVFFKFLRKKVFKKQNLEDFFTALDTLRICFWHEKKEIKASFFECIFGQLEASDGRAFFYYNDWWLKISAEYVTVIQRDFLQLLNRSLMDEKDPAFLTKPWMCEHSWSSFSLQDLQNVIGNESEKVIQTLLKQNYRFIHSNGKSLQKPLFGEIKKGKSFRGHWRSINRLLENRKTLTAELLEKEFNLKPSKSVSMLDALKKPYPIFRTINGRYVIMARLNVSDHFPRMAVSKRLALQKFLNERADFCLKTMDEGDYNEQYLFDQNNKSDYYDNVKGWLVGDRICPRNIEVFDILQYNESHVYFYAVKEKFGEETRVACSQIRVAASHVKAALTVNNSTNILAEFYDKATNEEPKTLYRKNVQKQLIHLTKEGFLSLFKKKKIVFVYAFIDSEGVNERLLFQESHTYKRILFEAKDFNNPECLNFRGNPNVTPDEIVKLLKEKKYLDEIGHITDSFLLAKQNNFALSASLGKTTQIPAIFNTIFNKISPLISQYNSIIAKMELNYLKKEIEKLGFSFKICQIRRPEAATGFRHESQDEATLSLPKEQRQYIQIDDPFDEVLIDLATRPTIADDDPMELEMQTPSSAHTAREEDTLTPYSQIFKVNSQKYKSLITRGQGSCALHALLGKLSDGEVRYPGEDSDAAVKTLFLDRLKVALSQDPQIKELLLTALREIFKGTSPEKKMIFLKDLHGYTLQFHQEAEQQVRIQEIKKKEGVQWLDFLNHSIYTHIRDVEKNNAKNYHLMPDPDLKEFFKKDPFLLFSIINAYRTNFLSFISDENKVSIAFFQIQLNDLQMAYEKLHNDYLSSQEVLGSYFEAIVRPDYYFNQEELKVAAYLFGKKIRIFSFLKGEYWTSEHDTYDPPNSQGDPVLIAHKGVHYERLEYLTD